MGGLLALTACATPSSVAAEGATSASPAPSTPAATLTRPPTPTPTLTASPKPSAHAVVSAPVPTPVPARTVRPPTATPQRVRPTGTDERVVFAAGVRQWIDCQGAGPVTVVVVTGLGTAASAWSPVRGAFQATTRTCFYDRPGLGNSPARPDAGQVLDAGLYARELGSLLVAAGEPGPYVVVGHSFGGLIARAFVVDNPVTVRGVMLAESVDPGDTTTGTYWHEAGHAVDMPRSQAADDGGPALGARPLVVVSASHPEEDHLGGPTYGQSQAATDQWIAEQHANLRLSSNDFQVIATSGHVLQQDDPPAVAEALRELVHAVATNGRLACSSVWASVAATCR